MISFHEKRILLYFIGLITEEVKKATESLLTNKIFLMLFPVKVPKLFIRLENKLVLLWDLNVPTTHITKVRPKYVN